MNDPRDPRRRVRLILRAQAGERAAFEELLESVQGACSPNLSGPVRDRHLAEDVLPEPVEPPAEEPPDPALLARLPELARVVSSASRGRDAAFVPMMSKRARLLLEQLRSGPRPSSAATCTTGTTAPRRCSAWTARPGIAGSGAPRPADGRLPGGLVGPGGALGRLGGAGLLDGAADVLPPGAVPLPAQHAVGP